MRAPARHAALCLSLYLPPYLLLYLLLYLPSLPLFPTLPPLFPVRIDI
ncbi:hypothetical protein PUN4_150033 [Paraburkholderia unamae]|nr:hypothetical protein PUN4_150033 [Paraburkholderia unamae]